MSELRAGVYQHYKGPFYLVLGTARHSETEEQLVAYVPLEPHPGPRITVRPYDMFFESVEVDGQQVERFKYIGEQLTEADLEQNVDH